VIMISLLKGGLIDGEIIKAQTSKWLDTSQLSHGLISITYPVKKNTKTKLMVMKGDNKYTYSLSSSRKSESFPLQMGNGDYEIYVLEQESNNAYKRVAKDKVTLKLENSHTVFLNSIQNVNWTSTDDAIVKAKQLTSNLKTDEEKVKAIYKFVYTTIEYDKKLAAEVTADYLPNIDHTLKTKKDICYGYASLLAAMLRSLDIPTKLIMGESSYVNEYHAWNEVYLNGKWVIVDTTVDADLAKANKKFSMIKDSKKYNEKKMY